MEKTEKIIIVGKSGSGKDYLLKQLSNKGFNICAKKTTRPQRKNEIQFKDYHFIKESDFKDLIDSNEIICYEKFEVTPLDRPSETWYYGISNDDFEKYQAFIMTPGELNQINESKRKGLYVVYLDIDREVREKRLHIREDNNDSIKRRLDADEIDFKDFNDYDLKITDPEFDVDLIIDFMV